MNFCVASYMCCMGNQVSKLFLHIVVVFSPAGQVTKAIQPTCSRLPTSGTPRAVFSDGLDPVKFCPGILGW
jgi:hypothetical protein